MKKPIDMTPVCDKCGKEAPIDYEMSTAQWKVYRVKEPCECGYNYEEVDVTPAEEMEQARKYGWTGTHRKCWCPDCSKRREALKDGY